MTTTTKLDTFTLAYIVCALWSTNDESDEQGGEPLDKNYGQDDIAPETLASMVDDCKRFQAEHWEMIQDDIERAGHDFWLTRNGHGAGFWDGDWPEHGDTLTEACEKWKEVNLYLGDDGKIYA